MTSVTTTKIDETGNASILNLFNCGGVNQISMMETIRSIEELIGIRKPQPRFALNANKWSYENRMQILTERADKTETEIDDLMSVIKILKSNDINLNNRQSRTCRKQVSTLLSGKHIQYERFVGVDGKIDPPGLKRQVISALKDSRREYKDLVKKIKRIERNRGKQKIYTADLLARSRPIDDINILYDADKRETASNDDFEINEVKTMQEPFYIERPRSSS